MNMPFFCKYKSSICWSVKMHCVIRWLPGSSVEGECHWLPPVLLSLLSTWRKLESFETGKLDWESGPCRSTPGTFPWFVNRGRSQPVVGCVDSRKMVLSDRKAGWASQEKQLSKQCPSAASASVPSFRFLPRLPSVNSDSGYGSQISPFLPKLVLVIINPK